MMKTRKLTFLAVAAVAVAICVKAQDIDLTDLRTGLASHDYEVRKAVVTKLLHTGQARPLTKGEIDLLLPPFRSDSDWRIKVRITAVLPFAAEKAQVLPPLIAALRERDDGANGGGNLQMYSCDALAKIGDSTALPAMRDWLTFLRSKPKEFTLLLQDLIKKTEQSIKELETKTKDQGSNKVPEDTARKPADPQR